MKIRSRVAAMTISPGFLRYVQSSRQILGTNPRGWFSVHLRLILSNESPHHGVRKSNLPIIAYLS